MAGKTLLQIVSTAQQELGLPQATTVVGNTDPATLQMYGLLNELGEDLRDYPEEGWSSQEIEFNLLVEVPITVTGNTTLNSPVITNISPNTTGLAARNWIASGSYIPQNSRILSVDSATQVTMNMENTAAQTAGTIVFGKDTYTMPTDFKYQQNRTWWDRTNHWELMGPDSPQEDQWQRSGIVASGPRRHFRIIGNNAQNTYRLWPPPFDISAPLQLVFEYQSINWVNVNNGGTGASSFANDADTTFLDDRALIKGLKYKYWQMKGFNYADMKNEFIDFVDRLVARDGAAPTLRLTRRTHTIFVSPSNIPDGNWPGPTGPNMS